MIKKLLLLLTVFVTSSGIQPAKRVICNSSENTNLEAMVQAANKLGLSHKFWWSNTVKPPITNEEHFPEIFARNYCSWIKKHEDISVEQELETYRSLVEYYEKQERILQFLRDQSCVSPFGGINYGMTLEQMKRAIESKFNVMKHQGLIISEDEFDKIKSLYYTQHHHTDLTRIWGAEYLKARINLDEKLKGKYDVPNYIIVANNQSYIQVTLWFNFRFPVVGYLKNAALYFKRIHGGAVGCGSEVVEDIGKKTAICYLDICAGCKQKAECCFDTNRQHENIREDFITGKRYIVDTEFSAFQVLLPSEEITQALEYGAKKFEYFNDLPLIRFSRSHRRQQDIYMMDYEFRLE